MVGRGWVNKLRFPTEQIRVGEGGNAVPLNI